MVDLKTGIGYQMDLNKGVQRQTIGPALLQGDAAAHKLEISCVRNGVPVLLSNEAVTGYFVRADGRTVLIDGTVEGSKACIVLPAACYAVEGTFELVVRVNVSGDSSCVIYWGGGAVRRSRTDALVDPGQVIPSLEELLAKIEAMEVATENANTAAETAVSTANEAAAAAKQTAADAAQAAKDTADEAAARADKATEELQGFADSISAQQLLQYDTIPNTTQHYTYDASGTLTAIQHMRDGAAVRTDAFVFGDAEIVETRTLATGEVLTITTNLDTLETTVEYAA